MRTTCARTKRAVKPVEGRLDPLPVHNGFPPARGRNGGRKSRDQNAVKFRLTGHVANWLGLPIGGGVRVAPNGGSAGQRTAILNRDLAIGHDDGRREFL